MLSTAPGHDVATDAQHTILGVARDLAIDLDCRWRTPGSPDDLMLLTADLLDAHADTGIEMQTWPRALDVVTACLAFDPHTQWLTRGLGVTTWFTVVGTWHNGKRTVVAVLPGRQHPHLADGTWTEHVQAVSPNAAIAQPTTESPPHGRARNRDTHHNSCK